MSLFNWNKNKIILHEKVWKDHDFLRLTCIFLIFLKNVLLMNTRVSHQKACSHHLNNITKAITKATKAVSEVFYKKTVLKNLQFSK